MSTSCSGDLKVWANLALWLQRRSSEILNNFPIQMLWGSYKCTGKQTWPCHKKVKCQRTTIFLAILVDLFPWWFVHRFSPKASSVLEKKIFKGFYHIWAWRPSWSMNRDHFSNLSFPWLKKAQYEIWANLAQWLQRRSNLKFWTLFLFKCMGLIQMHREANLTLP